MKKFNVEEFKREILFFKEGDDFDIIWVAERIVTYIIHSPQLREKYWGENDEGKDYKIELNIDDDSYRLYTSSVFQKKEGESSASWTPDYKVKKLSHFDFKGDNEICLEEIQIGEETIFERTDQSGFFSSGKKFIKDFFSRNKQPEETGNKRFIRHIKRDKGGNIIKDERVDFNSAEPLPIFPQDEEDEINSQPEERFMEIRGDEVGFTSSENRTKSPTNPLNSSPPPRYC